MHVVWFGGIPPGGVVRFAVDSSRGVFSHDGASVLHIFFHVHVALVFYVGIWLSMVCCFDVRCLCIRRTML